jgi:hypothetical protein
LEKKGQPVNAICSGSNRRFDFNKRRQLLMHTQPNAFRHDVRHHVKKERKSLDFFCNSN